MQLSKRLWSYAIKQKVMVILCIATFATTRVTPQIAM